MALSSATPVPGRIGDGDVAGAIGRDQPRHAERGIGPEDQRIEEIVVDAAVDHVDALRPLGRAHVDHLVAHEEVAPLDQFHAHAVGKEAVLVIGGVQGAGREQNDGRIARGCSPARRI